MDYPKNQWYVAGFDEELETGALLSRVYLGEPVVLFRDAEGQPHALQDRCPHRFAPLSAGEITSQGVMCRYHGLVFGAGGVCVDNPHGGIPRAAAIRSYPVVERDRLLWIWMGDSMLADSAAIPDFGNVAAAPTDAMFRGYLPSGCDTMLLVDNIMDLSHVDYLHPTSLGSGSVSRTTPVIDDIDAGSLKISWHSKGDTAPPALDAFLSQQGQPTDQWTEVTWRAPTNMYLEAGATLAGQAREQGVCTYNLHLGTPEEPGKSTHYWYWSTRNFAITPELNQHLGVVVSGAFRNEDKPMLEAQQRSMGGRGFWDLKPILLTTDAGAVRVRRKVAALLDNESCIAQA